MDVIGFVVIDLFSLCTIVVIFGKTIVVFCIIVVSLLLDSVFIWFAVVRSTDILSEEELSTVTVRRGLVDDLSVLEVFANVCKSKSSDCSVSKVLFSSYFVMIVDKEELNINVVIEVLINCRIALRGNIIARLRYCYKDEWKANKNKTLVMIIFYRRKEFVNKK